MMEYDEDVQGAMCMGISITILLCYIHETEWEGAGEGLLYLSVIVLQLIIGEMKEQGSPFHADPSRFNTS